MFVACEVSDILYCCLAVGEAICSSQGAACTGSSTAAAVEHTTSRHCLHKPQHNAHQPFSQTLLTLRAFSSSDNSSTVTLRQVAEAQEALQATSGQPQQATDVQAQQDEAPAAANRPQQPIAAAYGPRRVSATSSKSATKQKREGIVHVNSTFNNTIIVLTDRDNKVQTWTSGGTVGYKNANKATPMAAELAAKELAKRAVDMGFHSVVVKLKGMGKNKQFAVQSLAGNGLTVTQLWDVTPIPYNGCRLPRRRRV